MKQNKYLVFLGMGMELVGLVLTSVYVGQKIDVEYGTKGLALVGLSMASLAGWIAHIVLLSKKLEKSKEP